jgi:hypothetical protein
MLEPEQVAEIAREVAVANLARENIDFVMSEPAIDFEGQEALRITIVIEPGAAMRFEGDAVLNTLVEIHDRLLGAGEERPGDPGRRISDVRFQPPIMGCSMPR